jgi:adenosylmethionine-8-amino-7-oxononanoate aminotransferase
MTHILHRHTKGTLPVAAHGDGVYIVDSTGKRYLDACGGAAVSCLGHSHPRVIRAIQEQVQQLAYAHTSFFTNEPAERLAELLAGSAPGPLDHVYLVSGGSEAMEAALKLARQYFLERGEPSRRLFIARRQSYHGNTLGALSVGGNFWRRAPFDPLLAEARHVSPCYPYREQQPAESDDDYAQRLADELDATVREAGAQNVIAFVAEPVVGATAGALVPVPGYFRRIREVCDRHGMLLILDEVMCGMGRTGTLFAYEQEGIHPDIVAIAKGLGAGYQPIGATMLSASIYEAIRDGTGFFQHGHTYMAHPTACAGALAVQHAIAEENLLDNVRTMGEQLEGALLERFGNHPHVGDIRGRGLFRALEFVADRASKAPFDPAIKLNAHVKREAMARGLMCYPMGGTVDGARGDHVLIAPPFIIDDGHVAEIADKLGDAVDAAIAAAA